MAAINNIFLSEILGLLRLVHGILVSVVLLRLAVSEQGVLLVVCVVVLGWPELVVGVHVVVDGDIAVRVGFLHFCHNSNYS